MEIVKCKPSALKLYQGRSLPNLLVKIKFGEGRGKEEHAERDYFHFYPEFLL